MWRVWKEEEKIKVVKAHMVGKKKDRGVEMRDGD